jgi:hypothetical protein
MNVLSQSEKGKADDDISNLFGCGHIPEDGIYFVFWHLLQGLLIQFS